MKKCSKCKRVLDENHFNRDNSRKDGLNNKCKDCVAKYRKSNKERLLVLGKKYRNNRYIVNRLLLDELKSVPCIDCGRQFPVVSMHFDHISDDKSFTIASIKNTSSTLKILKEIEKCEVVCANCHAVRTHLRYLIKNNLIVDGYVIQRFSKDNIEPPKYMRKLLPAEEQDVITMYSTGQYTHAALAVIFKVSKQLISKIINPDAHTYPALNQRPNIRQWPDNSTLLELAKQYSSREIADMIGFSPSGVRRKIRNLKTID